jgi:methyltransferase (TIGR00027 family)
MSEPVSHISDTARWVAIYRAEETARPDALFRDPLAAKLAGERGREIAAATPKGAATRWSAVTRTKLMDDLVLDAIGQGCDRVLNLAAGLDTRPYRLALPPSLTWIEADLPALVDEKERLLADERPVCRLSRERVDLADAHARARFLDGALGDAAKALVITEGLVVYLEEAEVASLARDLAARAGVRWWMLDVLSPAIVKMIREQMGGRHPVRALVKWGPADGVAFFEQLGWRARDVQPILRWAARFRRAPWWVYPFMLFPDPDPRRLRDLKWSAVVQLERAT